MGMKIAAPASSVDWAVKSVWAGGGGLRMAHGGCVARCGKGWWQRWMWAAASSGRHNAPTASRWRRASSFDWSVKAVAGDGDTERRRGEARARLRRPRI
ncbi:hypothetical protein E2562_023068 [Oryza meyeriana var. granulata]|uniref:Uncharacterized protein n=1 Tax=Oryza meyeriana var. granulata TaxID=110450 RepID=A0A6G1EP16_9ORYZ|nr:hypothetical protein E2562_023068 [Oryza meyeriana var. granulata]